MISRRIDIWTVHPKVGTKPRGNNEKRWRVTFEGEEIGLWRNPECEAARYLIEKGYASREDMLDTYRDGLHTLSGRMGWFADRSVSETDGSPRFTKWAPHPNVIARKTASDGSEVD